MADFYQHRCVPTLHHLTDPPLEVLEEPLLLNAQNRSLALIMPAYVTEFQRPALPRIMHILKGAAYVEDIVVSMNGVEEEGFLQARTMVKRMLGQRSCHFLWNDGPKLMQLKAKMTRIFGIRIPHGKGANVWMAMGYLLARNRANVIVCHDSDILTYRREMLARLCFPTMSEEMGYEFCKGFYGRVSDRLYGRVTRLHMMPLIRALTQVLGRVPLLEYIDDFRYVLSGEFSINVALAQRLSLSPNWGLELGMLCEIFHHSSADRWCQADLGVNFDHKHSSLGNDVPLEKPALRHGLMKMAHEITLTLFHQLDAAGISLGPIELNAIQSAYAQQAHANLSRHQNDAMINCLKYSREEEELAIRVFARALREATTDFVNRNETPDRLPAWPLIFSELPDFAEQLVAAVEE